MTIFSRFLMYLINNKRNAELGNNFDQRMQQFDWKYLKSLKIKTQNTTLRTSFT